MLMAVEKKILNYVDTENIIHKLIKKVHYSIKNSYIKLFYFAILCMCKFYFNKYKSVNQIVIFKT